MDKETPKEIQNSLAKWKWQTAVLRLFHVLFAIIAIVFSLIVAAKINSFQHEQIEWLALVAAVSTGLLGGLDLGTKSNNMRKAWRVLNSAVIRYKEDPDFTIKDLMKAYDDGENTIGDVNAKI